MKGTILQFVVVWLLSPWLVHSGLYDVEVLVRVALDGGVSCTVVQDVALASEESATSNPVGDGSAAQVSNLGAGHDGELPGLGMVLL